MARDSITSNLSLEFGNFLVPAADFPANSNIARGTYGEQCAPRPVAYVR